MRNAKVELIGDASDQLLYEGDDVGAAVAAFNSAAQLPGAHVRAQLITRNLAGETPAAAPAAAQPATSPAKSSSRRRRRR